MNPYLDVHPAPLFTVEEIKAGEWGGQEAQDRARVRCRLALLELQARRAWMTKSGRMGRTRRAVVDWLAELVETPDPIIDYLKESSIKDLYICALIVGMDKGKDVERLSAIDSGALWNA